MRNLYRMFARRQPASPSQPTPPSAEPVNNPPSLLDAPEAHHNEPATGFADIYGSLTPRQISVISLYLQACSMAHILTAPSYRIGHWNRFDGWNGKSIVHVRSPTQKNLPLELH